MRTTLYLATARGLKVITGEGEDWQSKACLGQIPIQAVAVDPHRADVAYCGTFGNGMFRTEDRGRTWSPLPAVKQPNVMAVTIAPEGTIYAGTELSAVYRSDDLGNAWQPLHTLMTLPSAITWSFPPRPDTHHVQSILPSLARRGRLHVAVEAGALIRSNDAGVTWCDRVPSSPKDTHCLVVHPHHPAFLRSAAGDGYFESLDDGDSWRRITDGLEHEYCWSVTVGSGQPATVLLTAAKNAYSAHYRESACSFLYRRSEDHKWRPLHDGLPTPKGSRIASVAASHVEPGVFYCSIEGRMYRSSDDGVRWRELRVHCDSGIQSENATAMAISEEQ